MTDPAPNGDPIGPELRIDPDDWDRALAMTDGPQLVVAGPGTGKTEFLVRRVAHLIESGAASPDQILLLTFSRRSAADIRRRLLDVRSGSMEPVACSTFHSFAARLLEAKGTSALGWSEMPALLTGPEQVQLVSELLSTERPADWPAVFRPLLSSRTLAGDVTDFILRCRERRLSSEDVAAMVPDQPEWAALPGFIERYHAELRRRNRIDYGTLLDATITLLDDPEVAGSVGRQYRYVVVDEYQDTSPAQAALLEALFASTPNLTVAGDPYQSIYSFRGASLHNIDGFPGRFRHSDGTGATRIVLTTSLRVPPEILEAALAVTSGGELPGSAGPVVAASHSGRVDAHVFDQTSAEADWIAGEIERLHLVERIPLESIAILLRSTRHLLTELSRALARRSIPHDTPDQRLVDHPAVQILRDVTFAAAGELGDAAIRRLLLGPMFELELARERELVRARHRAGADWPGVLADQLPEAASLVELLAAPEWATDRPAVDGFWKIWETLDQIEHLAIDRHRPDFRAAWTAFSQALERQAERDPSITLLDYFRLADSDDFEAQPLLSYRDRSVSRVTLTTLHQAKGLEFDTVFIADAADSVFPDLRRGLSLLAVRALDRNLGSDHGAHLRFRLQEEMRLAYTAMTRASRRVVWTATRAGIDERERRPSRFMVTAAGATEVSQLGPPTDEDGPPITIRQMEAMLRRVVRDPEVDAARRLAALSVLTGPAAPWAVDRFAGVRHPGPDTGVLPATFTLSPSQADAYENCPRRYVLERRIGIGDGSNPYALYGSLIHEVLEVAERRALDRGEARSHLDDALEVLDSVWQSKASFGSPAHDEIWRRKGVELLQRMYDEWPAASGAPVALEHELALEIDGVRWRGIADRIERRSGDVLAVVDYKTSKSVPSKAAVADSMQLGFYVLAARADPEIAARGLVAGAETWYPAGSRVGWTRSFDISHLDDIVARMREIGASISAEDWTPKPGDACKSCSVRIVCPVQPEGREAYTP